MLLAWFTLSRSSLSFGARWDKKANPPAFCMQISEKSAVWSRSPGHDGKPVSILASSIRGAILPSVSGAGRTMRRLTHWLVVCSFSELLAVVNLL